MIKNKDNDYTNQDKHVAKSGLFCTDKFPLLCNTWLNNDQLLCPGHLCKNPYVQKFKLF